LAMPPKSDAPDIETIVAKVEQPSALKLALATWREVQRQYSDLATELRAAIAELQTAGGDGTANAGPLTKRIAELDQRLRGGQLRRCATPHCARSRGCGVPARAPQRAPIGAPCATATSHCWRSSHPTGSAIYWRRICWRPAISNRRWNRAAGATRARSCVTRMTSRRAAGNWSGKWRRRARFGHASLPRSEKINHPNQLAGPVRDVDIVGVTGSIPVAPTIFLLSAKS
jgi:hypothetical protein